MNALRILGGMALASLLASNVIASGNVEIIARGSSLHSANGSASIAAIASMLGAVLEADSW